MSEDGWNISVPVLRVTKPDSERSVEHVIPAALGAELTTDLVCHDCNQKAGLEVDAPFLDQLWILEARHRHQIPDRRGRIPGPPVVPGELADGTKVLAVLDRTGWRAKLIPTEEWHDAQTMTFGVDAADEQAFKKKIERLDKKFGAGATKNVGRVERDIPNPEITITFDQSISAWPRMGAKVALATARMKLREAYLISDSAAWLRKLLWGDLKAIAPAGTGVSEHRAGEHVTHPVMRITNPPPEHQIMLFGLPDKTSGVIFTLFGETRYFIRLGPTSAGTRGVFMLDPLRPRIEWLDWAAWETRIAERLMEADKRDRKRDPSEGASEREES